MKYRIRFNLKRGQTGRGTMEHVWRVFDETGKETVCKNVWIHVPSRGEKEMHTEDWNIVADGDIQIDRDTSTVHIL